MKKLSKTEFWQAYGLAVAAQKLQVRVSELDDMVADVLGCEMASHASDWIYNYPTTNDTPESFETALNKMGITTESL